LVVRARARRVPVTTMGVSHCLTPTLQLVCGVVLLGEHVPPARWVGFGLVWRAPPVLTTDHPHAARPPPAPPPAPPRGAAPPHPRTRPASPRDPANPPAGARRGRRGPRPGSRPTR